MHTYNITRLRRGVPADHASALDSGRAYTAPRLLQAGGGEARCAAQEYDNVDAKETKTWGLYLYMNTPYYSCSTET